MVLPVKVLTNILFSNLIGNSIFLNIVFMLVVSTSFTVAKKAVNDERT